MLRAGDRLGAYELVRPLGEGSFADVWLARHVHLLSRHAVKHLDPRWGAHPGLRGRFLSEGRILAQLRHPAIVPVTDLIDEGPDRMALVMAFVEGETLADRLAREGALAPAEAVAIVRTLCTGLQHAHEAGVVHRDVKPANVVLVPRAGGFDPVLLDFGVAKLLDEATVEGRSGYGTRASTRLGTPQYMSPEQIEASHAVDPRSDVFSLGTVLYELLSGRPAFDGATITEILFHVSRGVRRPLVGLPDEVVAVVDRAMEVDPDRRYDSAQAFERALGELGALSIKAPRQGAPPSAERVAQRVATQPTLAPASRSNALVLAGLLLAGLGGVALVAGLLHSPSAAPDGVPAVAVDALPEPEPVLAPGPEPETEPETEPEPEVPAAPHDPEPSAKTPDVRPPTPAPPPPPLPVNEDLKKLDRAWAAQSGALGSCVAAGAEPSTWKIGLSVGVDGAVSSVTARATRTDEAVARCLAERVRGFRFGALSDSRRKTYSITLPPR